jgi:ribosome-binding protein aMBF1 (putative translation factor)
MRLVTIIPYHSAFSLATSVPFDDFVTISEGRAYTMSAIDRHVGGRLRELRENAGMGGAQLAAELQATTEEISGFEQGSIRISSDTLLRLCRVFNVGPSYFFNEFDVNE